MLCAQLILQWLPGALEAALLHVGDGWAVCAGAIWTTLLGYTMCSLAPCVTISSPSLVDVSVPSHPFPTHHVVLIIALSQIAA